MSVVSSESEEAPVLPVETTSGSPASSPVAAEPASEPEPDRDGWTLVALLPHAGREPPADTPETLAASIWCAVSALWHPSLLTRAAHLPRIEPVDSPAPPRPREIRVIPTGLLDRLPSGYLTQVEEQQSALLEAGEDRALLIEQLQARLGASEMSEPPSSEEMSAAARDFLALGTVQWLLRELTIAMGHADALDHESLARELLGGARAWQSDDLTGAVNRLRAGFEILTQARERFYPVDAYFIDLCLLDASLSGGVLAEPLAQQVPISLLTQADAIERQALLDPERMAALRQAITDGWVDVAGGAFAEAEDPLLPLESVLWQFRCGGEVYRKHLDDRTVETYARRRFGLYTQLPQIAKRFGFRYALHLGFDAGRFPMRAETKRLWESPDGSSLESLMRPPLAADRPSQACFVPGRLAATMKNDHVAVLPLLHWARPVAPWYLDLRRVAAYAPVLGRWTTLHDFFHLTDRPYESLRTEMDAYETPFLAQAVARRDPEPVSRRSRHHRLRARLDAARAMEAFARAIAAALGRESTGPAPHAGGSPERPTPCEVEDQLETGRHGEAEAALHRFAAAAAAALTERVMGSVTGKAATGAPTERRPGYLVLNPIGISRRAAVPLPDAALDLRPEGPLRAAQFTDEGVHAVVELPAFGFAWVPREADPAQPPAVSGAVSARGRRLRNESIEIEVDAATGGIRRLSSVGESLARLGQQLIIGGCVDAKGKPAASLMRSEQFEIDFGGPALAQASARGTLINPRDGGRLGSFLQRYRLWAGRPVLEIDVTLTDLDPSWLQQAAQADPWSVYIASRWAWPDPSSMLRRAVFGALELTEAARPETPDVIDISTRNQRTALLFGGLAHHRMHGARMLDTLLVAGMETNRSFKLGVALDLEHPCHAAWDMVTPCLVVPTDEGPPALGASGWLAHLDQKAVAVSRVEFVAATGEDRAWGLIVHLLETGGQAARCRLRLFRNPSWARQVDFLGETIIDLSTEGDAVLIDLTPHELARVEVTLG
jgi:alpha-mannosidase